MPACDTVSAFGGIIIARTALTRRPPKRSPIFTEVVVAPDADEEAIALFAAKKNLRPLLTGALGSIRRAAAHRQVDHRRLAGPVARQMASSPTRCSRW